MYQSLIRRIKDQGFKIYKPKGNLSWLSVLQTEGKSIYFYYYYYYFIIRDEFEFNDLKYCVLIFVLNLNIPKMISQFVIICSIYQRYITDFYDILTNVHLIDYRIPMSC